MFGVLVSSKTLRGEKNKFPNRYPLVEEIGKIFIEHPLAMNVIHFHYSHNENETLLSQLEKLIEVGGGNLDGIQLNIAWPDPRSLERFRMLYLGMYKQIQLILQVGSKAFGENSSPEKIASKIKEEYLGLADYVLLDLSGGYGKLLDANFLEPFIEKIQEEMPGIGIGLAGGLDPETLDLIAPLIKKYPFLSIDEDHLDLNVVKEYLCKALAMFNLHESSK